VQRAVEQSQSISQSSNIVRFFVNLYFVFKMNSESDPNIIYGGDPSEFGPIDGGCGSLGGLIWSDLTKGENRTSFVSVFITTKLSLNLLNNFYFPRSMALLTKFGPIGTFLSKAF
jgi:hypothetical protein